MFRRYLMCFAAEGAATGGGTAAADVAAAATSAAASATGGAATSTATSTTSTAAPSEKPFAELLPEDIRGEAVFRDIKDLAGLAKSYHGAAKLLGRDPKTLLAGPGPDDAEGWAKAYAALGRPETAEGYKLPPTPEGLQESAELKTGFLKVAHEAGLSDRQAARLAEWWNGTAAGTAQAQTAAQERTEAAGIATLQAEWGNEFAANLDLAKKALANYGDEKLVAYLDSTRLGNDPALIRAFAKIGKPLAEDGILGRAGGGQRLGQFQ